MKKQAKRLLYNFGFYPFVRNLYRMFSPVHRRERFFNKHFFGEIVQSGDLCFDIGANVGQTIEALLQVNAVVIAVEPNTNCLPVLNYQFRKNSNVTIVLKAVGATMGFQNLYFSGTDSTASLRDDWPHPNDDVVSVEVTTLDALIAEFGLPRFLKVDVEGFELEVFQGLSQPVQLIYFEMHSHEMHLALQILERLSAIGQILGVNAVSGDNSTWLLDQWMPVELFILRLNSSSAGHAKFPEYANVLVKMAV